MKRLVVIVFFVLACLVPIAVLAVDGPTNVFSLIQPVSLDAVSSIAPMQASSCPVSVVAYTQLRGDESRVVAEIGQQFVIVADWADMASAWGPSVACNEGVVTVVHHEQVSVGEGNFTTKIYADGYSLAGHKLWGPVAFPQGETAVQNPRCAVRGSKVSCVYTDFVGGRKGQALKVVNISRNGAVSQPTVVSPSAPFQVYSSIDCLGKTCVVAGSILDTTNIFIRREGEALWAYLGSLAGQLPTVSINRSTGRALVLANQTDVKPNRLNVVTVDLSTMVVSPLQLDEFFEMAGDLMSYSATPVNDWWVVAVWNRTGHFSYPQPVYAAEALTAQAVGKKIEFPSVGMVGHLMNWCYTTTEGHVNVVECSRQVPPSVSVLFLPVQNR